MKKTIIFLFSSLLLINSSIKATNYYSDPATGSMSNTGSFAAPWAKLESIFSANKTFLSGDTIFLRNGNHGYPIVKGVNTNFVVIMPQVNHNPIISRINFSNTSGAATKYWKLYKLTVQSQAINGNEIWLVETLPSATYITISTCTVTTDANTTGWTRNNWRDRCNHGIATREKLNSNIIIEKNLILNTCLGVFLKASNMIFRDNIVKNFTKDATRILASNILFEGNRVTDLNKSFYKFRES